MRASRCRVSLGDFALARNRGRALVGEAELGHLPHPLIAMREQLDQVRGRLFGHARGEQLLHLAHDRAVDLPPGRTRGRAGPCRGLSQPSTQSLK